MSGLEELYGQGEDTSPAPEASAPPAESVVSTPEPTEPSTAPTEAPAAPEASSAQPQSDRDRDIAGLIRALQDERDQKKAARQEAEQLRAWRADQERRRQQAAAQAPDILEDPQGYMEWSERRQREVVQKAIAQTQAQQVRAVETLSRNMLVRHIGADKVTEIEAFSRSAPKQAVDEAYASGDPYGWFYEKFEQAQKHRKAQEAAKQLESFGGKSLEEVIAERVAAALAGQGQQPAAPIAAPAAPRNPDGTFAPQPTQRHTPQSLAEVNGAAVVASASSGSALEELYNN